MFFFFWRHRDVDMFWFFFSDCLTALKQVIGQADFKWLLESFHLAKKGPEGVFLPSQFLTDIK